VKVTIETAASKSNFEVVLELSLIWRALFVVDHCPSSLVRILRKSFAVSEHFTFLGVEMAREVVTVVDTEDSFIDFQIHWQANITPVVRLGSVTVNRYFVTLKENSLR